MIHVAYPGFTWDRIVLVWERLSLYRTYSAPTNNYMDQGFRTVAVAPGASPLADLWSRPWRLVEWSDLDE